MLKVCVGREGKFLSKYKLYDNIDLVRIVNI